ncbi:hypothetical protein QVD99_002901 [Batrachochytrium dendrobatidis]|nr:hypothetical protein O5D80_003207 [Batrachochytrium dendrobatidis]KAK5671140.1 hypothetical protein QVD99_002901 [Batrachochytrium dendrobatidis]
MSQDGWVGLDISSLLNRAHLIRSNSALTSASLVSARPDLVVQLSSDNPPQVNFLLKTRLRPTPILSIGLLPSPSSVSSTIAFESNCLNLQ